MINTLLSPGTLAIKLYRRAHRLHRNSHARRAKALSMLARFLTGIEIHPNARIGERLTIRHGMGIVIGQATIGDDCVILQGVTVGKIGPRTKAFPTIGNRVYIGCGAAVLGDITIGDDAVIGAHAVVLKDVPVGATVVGNPARVAHAAAG